MKGTKLDLKEMPAADRPVTQLLHATATALKVAADEVADRVEALVAESVQLEKKIQGIADTETTSADSLLLAAEAIGGMKLVVAEIPGGNPTSMRSLIDQLRRTAGPVAVLLAGKQTNDKVILVAGLSDELVAQGMHAGNWVGCVAKILGGGGGGKANMAQAGGRLPENLPRRLKKGDVSQGRRSRIETAWQRLVYSISCVSSWRDSADVL